RRYDGSVSGGCFSGQRGDARRGRRVHQVKHFLDCYRHSVERSELLALLARFIGTLGMYARGVEHGHDKRVQGWVDVFDSPKMGFKDLLGGTLAVCDQPGQIASRRPIYFSGRNGNCESPWGLPAKNIEGWRRSTGWGLPAWSRPATLPGRKDKRKADTVDFQKKIYPVPFRVPFVSGS